MWCDVYIVKMLSEKITLIISAWADTIYYLFRFKKLKNRFSLFFTPWTPTRIFNENLLGFDFSSLSFAYFQMTFLFTLLLSLVSWVWEAISSVLCVCKSPACTYIGWDEEEGKKSNRGRLVVFTLKLMHNEIRFGALRTQPGAGCKGFPTLKACNWDLNSSCLVGVIEFKSSMTLKNLLDLCLASMLSRMDTTLDCMCQQSASTTTELRTGGKMTPVRCCARQTTTFLSLFMRMLTQIINETTTHHIADFYFDRGKTLTAVNISHRTLHRKVRKCPRELWEIFSVVDLFCMYSSISPHSIELRSLTDGQVFFVQSRLNLRSFSDIAVMTQTNYVFFYLDIFFALVFTLPALVDVFRMEWGKEKSIKERTWTWPGTFSDNRYWLFDANGSTLLN